MYYAQAYIKLTLCGKYEVSCSLKIQPPISISLELAAAPWWKAYKSDKE
jgi:hypothetical protein